MNKNNFQEKHLARWNERNSLKKNKEYICKLLEHFNILPKNYNFTVDGYGDLSLSITLKKKYLIQIDKEEVCYNLLEENLALNPRKKPKYHLIEKFYGNELMEDVLRYIKNKEGYKK